MRRQKDVINKQKDIKKYGESSNPKLDNLRKKGFDRILFEAGSKSNNEENFSLASEARINYRNEGLKKFDTSFNSNDYFDQARKDINAGNVNRFKHITEANLEKYDNFTIEPQKKTGDQLREDNKYSKISVETLKSVRKNLALIRNDTGQNVEITKIAQVVHEAMYQYMSTRIPGLHSGFDKRVIEGMDLPPEDPIVAMDLALSTLKANASLSKSFKNYYEKLTNELNG